MTDLMSREPDMLHLKWEANRSLRPANDHGFGNAKILSDNTQDRSEDMQMLLHCLTLCL